MTTPELQALIIKEGGVILSDGTLNLQHLLPKAYDLIQKCNIETDLADEIRKVFIGDEPTFYNQFYGNTKLDEAKEDEASYLWNEDIYYLFNNIAPEGYSFGSSEDDGACIGWFKYEDDDQEEDEF